MKKLKTENYSDLQKIFAISKNKWKYVFHLWGLNGQIFEIEVNRISGRPRANTMKDDHRLKMTVLRGLRL